MVDSGELLRPSEFQVAGTVQQWPEIPLEKRHLSGTRSQRRSLMETDMAHSSDPVNPAREGQCG